MCHSEHKPNRIKKIICASLLTTVHWPSIDYRFFLIKVPWPRRREAWLRHTQFLIHDDGGQCKPPNLQPFFTYILCYCGNCDLNERQGHEGKIATVSDSEVSIGRLQMTSRSGRWGTGSYFWTKKRYQNAKVLCCLRLCQQIKSGGKNELLSSFKSSDT